MKEKREQEPKCGDCSHYKLTGWWDPQRGCDIVGFPVNKNGPVCISFLSKNDRYGIQGQYVRIVRTLPGRIFYGRPGPVCVA